jgi:hypothetical protein
MGRREIFHPFSLLVEIEGHFIRSVLNQWEEEKYFILFRYWLKSVGTFYP